MGRYSNDAEASSFQFLGFHLRPRALNDEQAVEDYAPNTLLINEIYAKRYNYAFIYGRPSTSEIRSSRRHVSWHKLRLALQVLEDNTFDYVMWMDLDAIFHNHWIRIEEMIAERPGADFYICTNNKEDLSNFPLGRVDRRIVVNCGVWIVSQLSDNLVVSSSCHILNQHLNVPTFERFEILNGRGSSC